MSDDTDAPEPEPTDDDASTEQPTEPQGDVDWKAEARKWEERAKKDAAAAKKHAEAAKELEKFRKQSMTETEQQIEAARQEARREVLVETGSKVAAAEIRAAAAGRLEAEQLETLIDGINLARFIDDDGDVDREAVVKFVDGIAPKSPSRGALDQGARGAGGSSASPAEQFAATFGRT